MMSLPVYRCGIFTYFVSSIPCGSAGQACNAGDLALIPGLGRSPGEGKGSILAQRIPWPV